MNSKNKDNFCVFLYNLETQEPIRVEWKPEYGNPYGLETLGGPIDYEIFLKYRQFCDIGELDMDNISALEQATLVALAKALENKKALEVFGTNNLENGKKFNILFIGNTGSSKLISRVWRSSYGEVKRISFFMSLNVDVDSLYEYFFLCENPTEPITKNQMDLQIIAKYLQNGKTFVYRLFWAYPIKTTDSWTGLNLDEKHLLGQSELPTVVPFDTKTLDNYIHFCRNFKKDQNIEVSEEICTLAQYFYNKDIVRKYKWLHCKDKVIEFDRTNKLYGQNIRISCDFTEKEIGEYQIACQLFQKRFHSPKSLAPHILKIAEAFDNESRFF